MYILFEIWRYSTLLPVTEYIYIYPASDNSVYIFQMVRKHDAKHSLNRKVTLVQFLVADQANLLTWQNKVGQSSPK